MDIIIAGVLVIIIFGILVFVHEFGHFWVARKSGVVVEEFALGFGPKIFSYYYKGTNYRINTIPLGGYVKMLGDLDGSSFERYSSKKYSKKNKEFALNFFASHNLSEKSSYDEITKLIENQKEKLNKDQINKIEEYIKYDFIPNHPGNFDNIKAINKVGVLIAGVIMNLILGIFLFYVVFAVDGYQSYIRKIGNPIVLGAEVYNNFPILHYSKDDSSINNAIIIEVNNQIIKDSNHLINILDESYDKELTYKLITSDGVIVKNLVLNGQGIKSSLDLDLKDGVFISEINENSILIDTEIKKYDRLIRIADKKLVNDINIAEIIKQNAGNIIDIEYLNLDKGVNEVIKVNIPKDNPLLGISYYQYAITTDLLMILDYTDSKLFSGIYHAFNMIYLNAYGLGYFINQSFAEKSLEPISSAVGSIVTVVDITHSLVAVDDFMSILTLTALLSVTLAFFNILPIPLLDGGHIMFLIIEKIRGKALSPKKQEMIATIFFVVLIGLTLLLVAKDIIFLNWPQRIYGLILDIFK
jgi:regulator of sigma E protease